jgi:hypothetical protein
MIWQLTDVVSVWRPVRFPIEDYPLAVADGSTVDPNDLIAADYVRTTYQGENLLPLYNKNCRWHYMSDQTPDDILLFKSYDSREQSKAKCKWLSYQLCLTPLILCLLRLSSCIFPSYQDPRCAKAARKHRSEGHCLLFRIEDKLRARVSYGCWPNLKAEVVLTTLVAWNNIRNEIVFFKRFNALV